MRTTMSPVGKGKELRRLMTNASFRGAVKCAAPYPVESELPERLQALLKLMDEAEKEAIRISEQEGGRTK